ncbi:MAG: B12-binding domain-containing radical SAM protein [archaeon]
MFKKTHEKNLYNGKKKVKLVSISFAGRDLNLSVAGLKSYAIQNSAINEKYDLTISQYFISDDDSSITNDLLSNNDDYYCFSCYVWNINKVLAIAKDIKEKLFSSFIVLGGPELSGVSERFLAEHDFIDFAFEGECEKAFSDFLLCNEFSKVPNLTYREGGTTRKNAQEITENLNLLPLPYELAEYRNYIDSSPFPLRAAIETSRGCPFTCGYCSWGGNRIRYYSLEKLKPAFEYLLLHPNVKTVYITDSNPLLKKDRAISLLSFLIEKNIHKKQITFELNPELINDEALLELISKLSEEEFAFGVQSTSLPVLQKIKRNFNMDTYKRNVLYLKKINPRVKMMFSLIIGLPGDNYEQYKNTFDFILGFNPTGIYAHELLCLPGSDFFSKPQEYGITYSEEAPHKVLTNSTFNEKEYLRAKKLSYNICLIHLFPQLREEINLFCTNVGIRYIEFYELFSDYLASRHDTLSGNKIEDVSSWFFEKMALDYLSAEQNRLALVYAFEECKRRFYA